MLIKVGWTGVWRWTETNSFSHELHLHHGVSCCETTASEHEVIIEVKWV